MLLSRRGLVPPAGWETRTRRTRRKNYTLGTAARVFAGWRGAPRFRVVSAGSDKKPAGALPWLRFHVPVHALAAAHARVAHFVRRVALRGPQQYLYDPVCDLARDWLTLATYKLRTVAAGQTRAQTAARAEGERCAYAMSDLSAVMFSDTGNRTARASASAEQQTQWPADGLASRTAFCAAPLQSTTTRRSVAQRSTFSPGGLRSVSVRSRVRRATMVNVAPTSATDTSDGGEQQAPSVEVPVSIPVPESYLSRCKSHHLESLDAYKQMYARSIQDPQAFWSSIARESFYWRSWPEAFNDSSSTTKCLTSNFAPSENNPAFTSFAKGAQTNISYNCLDRHVEDGRGNDIAIIFEPNDPTDESSRCKLSYSDMLDRVKEFAAALREQGVQKGDIVTIYMPMVPDLPIAMLACARIGAVHSVVFGGFSAESLAGRMRDAKSTCVVTCDAVYRGKKLIPLKAVVDEAVELCIAGEVKDCVEVSSVIVLERVGSEKAPLDMVSGRDIMWKDAVEAAKKADASSAIEWVDAEHPLFVLYTSGSTGRPKGIQHTTGGYMVYTATTFKFTFNYQPGDVFFCTADCGWITGHSYVTYGPMLNAATQVVFEGIPSYPDCGRLWDITDRYNVAVLYTAPTAIRALKRAGDEFVTKYSRASLKILGSVGEPINPEAYMWYYSVVGNKSCPIMDTVRVCFFLERRRPHHAWYTR